MPAALLDTNAVSDLMRDDPKVKARLAKHSDPIATNVVVVGEIRYGLERMPTGKKLADLEARAQAILAALGIELVTEQVGQSYGSLKAALEAQGVNLDDNDLWIAACAMTLGSVLITRDKIFKQVPGLHVENWSL